MRPPLPVKFSAPVPSRTAMGRQHHTGRPALAPVDDRRGGLRGQRVAPTEAIAARRLGARTSDRRCRVRRPCAAGADAPAPAEGDRAPGQRRWSSTARYRRRIARCRPRRGSELMKVIEQHDHRPAGLQRADEGGQRTGGTPGGRGRVDTAAPPARCRTPRRARWRCAAAGARGRRPIGRSVPTRTAVGRRRPIVAMLVLPYPAGAVIVTSSPSRAARSRDTSAGHRRRYRRRTGVPPTVWRARSPPSPANHEGSSGYRAAVAWTATMVVSRRVVRNCITRYGHPRRVFQYDTTSPTPPGVPTRNRGRYPP